MDTVIIALLVLPVCLLGYLIFTNKATATRQTIRDDTSTKLPDIMGRPDPEISNRLPSPAKSDIAIKASDCSVTFDPVTEVKSSGAIQEEPGAIVNVIPDWREVEEEELERYVTFGIEEGLATGVTFDELATVGSLLERETLQASDKNIAAGILSKIDGTELLSLLESNTGDTSKKIAMLLDGYLLR